MTIDGVERFLESFDGRNYSLDEWLMIEELQSIDLETDGNQFLNPFANRIYFDSTNDIIKIKNISSRRISGALNATATVEGNVITVRRFNDSYFERIALPIQGADFVKKDDKIFKVKNRKQVGQVLDVTEVIKHDNYIEIVLSGNLTVEEGERICFAMGEFYGESERMNVNEAILLYKIPSTTNVADTYLDLAKVSGFSLA